MKASRTGGWEQNVGMSVYACMVGVAEGVEGTLEGVAG